MDGDGEVGQNKQQTTRGHLTKYDNTNSKKQMLDLAAWRERGFESMDRNCNGDGRGVFSTAMHAISDPVGDNPLGMVQLQQLVGDNTCTANGSIFNREGGVRDGGNQHL